MLGIVIPALNASGILPECLAALSPAPPGPMEIVVVDGGSQDDTAGLARRSGARVISSARGRGHQLRVGAAAVRGEWLLFLHADTVLGAGWQRATAAFIADPANRERAAVFAFALDDAAPTARRLERLVGWRNRWLGLPYGDQGLLISRSFYDAIGGFRALELMEDVDIVRRIGRRRLVLLDVPAVTSAARFRSDGYRRRPIRNLACLLLYFLGLPPRVIARLYG